MKWLRWAFWGIVTGVDFLALCLLIDLYFGGSSVLYMLWDHTGSVWLFVAGGAMLGTSFGISKTRNIKNKIPRRVRTGAVSHLQITSPQSSCQRVTVRRG